MSDIPRSEVERVMEELRKARATACGEYGVGIHAAAERVAALLKPKQYKVEWWVGVDQEGRLGLFHSEPSKKRHGVVAKRHHTDTLEHGEGIE